MYPGASGNCCFKECKARGVDGSCCTKDMPCGLNGGDCDGGNQYTSEIKLKQTIFKISSVPETWSAAQIIVGQFGVPIHPVHGIAAFNNQETFDLNPFLILIRRLYEFGSINKI